MDDDAVLRELGADLERDDPRLAALLGGADDGADGGVPHRPWWVLLLVLAPPALMGLFLVEEAAFGVAVLLLGLVPPLVVCWLLCSPPGRPPPGRPPPGRPLAGPP